MSLEENRAICRRFYEEVMNRGELAVAEEIFAPLGTGEAPAPEGTRRPTPEGIRRLAERFRTAFPDLHMTVDWQIAEGDMVATQWTFRGTHLAAHAHRRGTIAPTGRQVTWRGNHTFRIVDRKIVQEWLNTDSFSLLEQLGAEVKLP